MAIKRTTKKASVKKPVSKLGRTKRPLRKAQDGITTQGPLTQYATNYIENHLDRPRTNEGPTADGRSYGKYPLNYDATLKRIVTETSLNPKNAKKISQGKEGKLLMKAFGKSKNLRALRKAAKADGWKEKFTKDERNALLAGIGTALGGSAITAFTNNPLRRAIKNAWTLEKKKGGSIKNASKKMVSKTVKKKK
jgi:hypothetical protein